MTTQRTEIVTVSLFCGARTRLQNARRQISWAWLIGRPLSPKTLSARNRRQAEMLADYVCNGDRVLDVGCGRGYLCKHVEEIYGAVPTGLDVKDFRAAPIAFRCFDGTAIPFPDQSFDHVVLSFALHHSQDPMALIKECRRVARRGILIFEDLPESRFGRFVFNLHLVTFAQFYRVKTPRPTSTAYRSALAWLNTEAARVVQTPFKWPDPLYVPHFLVAYVLAGD